MTWQNIVKSAASFLNQAITGIALWSDLNATWSDSQFTWADIGIAYANQSKSAVTTRAFLPFGGWLFWFTQEQDTTTPIAWNYETKH